MSQNANSATLGQAHAPSNAVFGFWIYLMTDCLLFGCFFAAFAVLSQQFNGGSIPSKLFETNGVMWETGALLLSSITYGFAMVNAHQRKSGGVLLWLVVTFVLGVVFLKFELGEFAHLIGQGNGPDRSAFLSSFYSLVSLHGLHVFTGLIWMLVMMFQVIRRPQLGATEIRRLTCLSLFWHFLDIVWICVFSFVYLGSMVNA
jgi:cytochrome o ubiquinol oxidase subunit 3